MIPWWRRLIAPIDIMVLRPIRGTVSQRAWHPRAKLRLKLTRPSGGRLIPAVLKPKPYMQDINLTHIWIAPLLAEQGDINPCDIVITICVTFTIAIPAIVTKHIACFGTTDKLAPIA